MVFWSLSYGCAACPVYSQGTSTWVWHHDILERMIVIVCYGLIVALIFYHLAEAKSVVSRDWCQGCSSTGEWNSIRILVWTHQLCSTTPTHLFSRKTITSKLHKFSCNKKSHFTLHLEHISLALNHESNKKTDQN